MRKAILFSFFAVSLIGCSSSILTTGEVAENNTIDMMYVKKGMASCDVADVMGNPYKTKTIVQDDITYTIWYYVTEGTVLGQKGYYPSNFTPFIFKEGTLIGWGRPLYRELFEKNPQVETLQNNSGDWPLNEHKLILPAREDRNISPSLPEAKEPPAPNKPADTQGSNNQHDNQSGAQPCEKPAPSAWWE